jgi:AraC family transcriptional regulator
MTTAATHSASRGFHVARRLLPAGVSEVAGATTHIVSLHVGAPVRAVCTRDGRAQSALQIPGDIEIVPVGDSGRWVDEGPAELLRITLDPPFFNTVSAGLGLDPRRVELTPQSRAHDSEIEHICLALESACARVNGGSSLFVDSLGMALGARLIERFANVRVAQPSGSLSRRQLNAVTDYVEANLTRPLTLKDLAAVAGVSVSHFKTLFKNAVGAPAHAYLVRRRVDRAAQLIKEGDSPLSQIALEAGFAHQSHLARAMRKTLGVTPGSLARAYRM